MYFPLNSFITYDQRLLGQKQTEKKKKTLSKAGAGEGGRSPI